MVVRKRRRVDWELDFDCGHFAGDGVADQLILEVVSSLIPSATCKYGNSCVVAVSEQRGCPRVDETSRENACVHSVQAGQCWVRN